MVLFGVELGVHDQVEHIAEIFKERKVGLVVFRGVLLLYFILAGEPVVQKIAQDGLHHPQVSLQEADPHFLNALVQNRNVLLNHLLLVFVLDQIMQVLKENGARDMLAALVNVVEEGVELFGLALRIGITPNFKGLSVNFEFH